jgi:hypothetical protein
MNRRFAVLMLAGLILSGGVGFTALAADDALPKAETILDRYIEVTGGKAAYEKRKTEVAKGMLEMAAQGVKAAVTRYSAAPDKSYSLLEIEGAGKIESGAGNGIAWDNSAMMGPHLKSGEEKAQALREAMFNAQLEWRKVYSKVETAGVETIDGEECYKVVLTPAESGKPETQFFQKKSGLAVKMTMTLVNQMGEVPAEVLISDYKEFGGVLIPTKQVNKAAGQEFTTTIQSVSVNEEIPPERFDPPAEIKALLNKK